MAGLPKKAQVRSALVGRDRELGALLECLDEALRGRANLVVCVGEPGIGKTRLVEELTGQARERGVLTAWGGAASTDGAPPYWPWREVLRAREAAGVAGPGALTDLAVSGVEPSLAERVRKFDEVAQLVLAAAKSRPLLVVLDDLHGMDEASQQVELRGLERAAVAEQVSGIVGRAASDTQLAAVYDATAGNPLFVCELARQLADGPTLAGTVPRSVRDAIGQRLGRLSADCAASLRAAALLGTRFAVPLVAAMTERNVGDCLASLDEAAGAALVIAGGAPGERRFAHDLVRDAIAAGLGSGQRIALHRRAAEAIVAGTPHPDGVAVEVAHHWAEAAMMGTGPSQWRGRSRPAARRCGCTPTRTAGAGTGGRSSSGPECWTTRPGAGC